MTASLRSIVAEEMDNTEFPKGQTTAEIARRSLDALAHRVKLSLEAKLAPDDMVVALGLLHTLPFAGGVIRALSVSMSAVPQDEANHSVRAKHLRNLLQSGGLAKLFIGVFFILTLVALHLSPILLLGFFLAYVLVDFARIFAFPHKSEFQESSVSRSPLDPPLNADALRVDLQQAMSQGDLILQAHHNLRREVRELRERVSVPRSSSNDWLTVVQHILGASRRNHPQLKEVIESNIETALDQVGLVAVSAIGPVFNRKQFDLQESDEMTASVELFPAFIERNGGKTKLRGRVVVAPPS